MAVIRHRRQAATHKGIARRVGDARFSSVTDTRQAGKVLFPAAGVLGLISYGLCSGANTLALLETRSEQLRAKARQELGLREERIADNTIGGVLRSVLPCDVLRSLHRQVKTEWRRGNLAPDRLESGRSVVAVDGKALSTLYWRDLQLVTRNELAASGDERTADPEWKPAEQDVRTVFATRFPWVQLVRPQDESMHGLLRMHRATLVSSQAAVCVHQRPIPGATNEIGAMAELLAGLFRAYGRTGMLDIVTADAGNTSLAVASKIVTYGADYFLAIKAPHGDIHTEAMRMLGENADAPTLATHCEERDGTTVTYELSAHPMPAGYLGWTHARQLLRVERIAFGPEGPRRVGHRYFVTSLDSEELDPEEALALTRMHWRCENEGHWTSDVYFSEDARRQCLSRHPVGMLNAAHLRMIAQNIVAVLRALSRYGPKKKPPSWREVIEHAFFVLFETVLATDSFDAEDAACAA